MPLGFQGSNISLNSQSCVINLELCKRADVDYSVNNYYDNVGFVRLRFATNDQTLLYWMVTQCRFIVLDYELDPGSSALTDFMVMRLKQFVAQTVDHQGGQTLVAFDDDGKQHNLYCLTPYARATLENTVDIRYNIVDPHGSGQLTWNGQWSTDLPVGGSSPISPPLFATILPSLVYDVAQMRIDFHPYIGRMQLDYALRNNAQDAFISYLREAKVFRHNYAGGAVGDIPNFAQNRRWIDAYLAAESAANAYYSSWRPTPQPERVFRNVRTGLRGRLMRQAAEVRQVVVRNSLEFNVSFEYVIPLSLCNLLVRNHPPGPRQRPLLYDFDW